MELNKIYQGDSLTVLKTFPDECIDCCITSPPYYGLRDYNTGKWEGGDAGCSHKRDSKWSVKTITGHSNKDLTVGDAIYKDICPKCGAKRIDKQLGLEKTPEEYVNKIVELFREVRRVLKKEGTLWLNLGDCYSAGGRGGGGKQGTNKGSIGLGTWKVKGLDSKNLVGIPWRVAFALQSDGWILRSEIIWYKPNPMPESVTDRPTKSHEQIFLFAKNQKYYYDNEAIKEKSLTNDNSVRDRDISKLNNTPGRSKMGGLKTNNYEKRNKRSVWVVSTKPFKESHFATFPEALILPMVLAGCPKGGTVFDPFMGAGTVGLVAMKQNRNYVGIELNPEYIKMAEKRIADNKGLF